MIAKINPNTQYIGQNIIYFNQIDSTNNFAQQFLLENKAENGTTIIAEEQINGRGQQNKTWISEPFKNIAMSIILTQHNKQHEYAFFLNKLICLSVFKVIKNQFPLNLVKIKWPNDIFVDHKKIAGILIENSFSGKTINNSILGIGININQSFNKINNFQANSFFDILGKETKREPIVKELLETIEKDLENQNTTEIAEQYEQNLYHYHTKGMFIFAEQKVIGSIQSCDEYGRLNVLINNTQHLLSHGEITTIIE